MSRRLRAVCLLTLFGLLPISSAVAQTRTTTPAKGVVGYGGDLGVLFPDETFENTLTFDGFGEYYLTPRISVRGLLGFASPGFNGRTEDHFRQVKLLFGGVYNWEYDNWRPFATAGAGFYFVREHFDGLPDPPGETRGGLNLGGGAEYVLNSESAIKIELRWDIVSHPNFSPDATGLSLTFGYKRYF